MQGLLIERLRIVSAAVPLDITGAGFNGDWVHLKHWRRALVVLQSGAWAGGTAAVTLEQATDASGTSGKALAFAYQYVSTALTSDVPTKTTVTSNTFNISAANKLHVIDLHAQDLDIANGFTHFRAVVATPGANADLLACLYILGDGVYSGLASTLPSVID